MNEFFPEIDDAKKDDILIDYRNTFKSVSGKKVLSDILVNFCHFGAYLDPHDTFSIGQYNVGISILGRLGVFSQGRDAVINALLDIPINT